MISKITQNITACLMLVFVLVLINGVVHAITNVYSNAESVFNGLYGMTTKPIYYIILLLLLVALVAITVIIIKKLLSVTLKKYHFLLIICFMFTIGLLNIINSEVVLQIKGDSLHYYNYGKLISKNISLLDFNNIYHQRVLFYTVPIFCLLPVTLASVQFINLLIYLVSAVLFTHVILKDFNKHIAFYFLLLYAFSFEFFAVITIPSHDLASIFYFSVLALLLYVLGKYQKEYFKYAVIITIALLIVVNDFQRTIKIPLLITLTLMLLSRLNNIKEIYKSISAINILCILICVIGFFYCVNNIKDKFGENDTFYDLENMVYSYNDIYTKGDYYAGQDSRENFITLMPKNDKLELVFHKYATQVADYPLDLLILLQKKATTLFSTTPWDFSFMDKRFNDFESPGYWILKPAVMLLFLLFKLFCFFLAALGVLNCIKKIYLNDFFKIYIIYPIVLLPLLFLSEVNSSYGFLFYPVILFFGALGIESFISKKAHKPLHLKKQILNPIILTSTLLCLVFVLFKLFVTISPVKLIDFNKNDYVLQDLESIVWNQSNLTNPFELNLKVEDNSFGAPLLTIQTEKDIFNVSFFIKSKIYPEDLVVCVNSNEIDPLNFHTMQSNNEVFSDYYYYYFNSALKKTTEGITFEFASLPQDFTIKDILLK